MEKDLYNNLKKLNMRIMHMDNGEYTWDSQEYINILECLSNSGLSLNTPMITFEPVYWNNEYIMRNKPTTDESDILTVYLMKSNDKNMQEKMLIEHDAILTLHQINKMMNKKIEKYNLFAVILNKIEKIEEADKICFNLYVSYMGY